MQTCIWRDLRIELPEDWEMLQFSLQRQAGRCAFADRYQFRLELGWRTAEAKPEIERMMSDYLAQMKPTPTQRTRRASESDPGRASRAATGAS